MDSSQSSTPVCVGVARGVGTDVGVDVTWVVGSIPPNTLTTAVGVAVSDEIDVAAYSGVGVESVRE